MPTLRKGPSRARATSGQSRSVTVFESVSPYGSRRVAIEYDGTTTAAYLYDKTGPVAAAWIANHLPASPTVDASQLSSGRAPEMPAGHTKHPDGRRPLDQNTIRARWMPEGDGVAIFERDEALAVLAGWSGISAGLPGYCRDAIGQTPFGWSLDDAMEGLGPRLDEAERFWRWRANPQAWAQFQQALLGHLLTRIGPGGGYWDVGGGRQPPVGVSERPAVGHRPFTVLSTAGMSAQRMPVVEQTGDSAPARARIELALATTQPSTSAARIFLWLAQYPWRSVTWLGAGHTIAWYHEPATFPLGGGNEAVLLLDDPAALPGPQPPDLAGFTVGGEQVRWLWIIPISGPERALARERGSASLVTHLAAQRRTWVIG